jgi:hypothetical protein
MKVLVKLSTLLFLHSWIIMNVIRWHSNIYKRDGICMKRLMIVVLGEKSCRNNVMMSFILFKPIRLWSIQRGENCYLLIHFSISHPHLFICKMTSNHAFLLCSICIICISQQLIFAHRDYNNSCWRVDCISHMALKITSNNAGSAR